MGMDTISSDTACYPAKRLHGTLSGSLTMGLNEYFIHLVNYEINEDITAPNHYNCPVVATYPEVIKNNMDDIFNEQSVDFESPFLPYDDECWSLQKRLHEIMKKYDIGFNEILELLKQAEGRPKSLKKISKMELMQLNLLRIIIKKAVVLAGRPYHLDLKSITA